jgi:hypothetical protein
MESQWEGDLPMSNVCAGIQLDDKSDFPQGTHILISQKVQQTIKLPLSVPLQIKFGQNLATCNIDFFISQEPLIRIRKDIAENLLLFDGVQLNARYNEKENRLELGPVLGVLISHLAKSSDDLFGSASSFCKEVVQGAKAKGALAYIFTMTDLYLDKQIVMGWTWQGEQWNQCPYPLPDIVYNRITSRKQEKSEEVSLRFSTLKTQGVFIFNESFLNKWQIHQLVSAMPEVNSILPSTHLYKGFFTLRDTLSRFWQIYLKPTNGSLGQGIYRISKENQKYICHQSTMAGSIQKSYQRLTDLYQAISPRVSKIPYLVQQGLNLIRINGNPLDFRALVQKDIYGKWTLTSIVARIGQDQSIVSNLARGGTIMGVNTALAAAGPWNTFNKPTPNDLKEVSLLLANKLEAALEGHFAEFGIDLAVDIFGKIWLLEVNSKPSKNDDQVLSEQKTRPSVKKILDYSLYLYGYKKPKPKRTKSVGRKRGNSRGN